jgi:hypothetical protein
MEAGGIAQAEKMGLKFRQCKMHLLNEPTFERFILFKIRLFDSAAEFFNPSYS